MQRRPPRGRRPASRRTGRGRRHGWLRSSSVRLEAGGEVGRPSGSSAAILSMRAVVAALLGRGGQEGVERVEGDDGPSHAAAEADDVGVVVLAGQRGRGHVVDHGGPDAGDLVGGDGDADAGAAGADTQLGPPVGHGPPDRRPVVGVVDRDRRRRRCRGRRPRGPGSARCAAEDLLQGEPGVVGADGDAHGAHVYRRHRASSALEGRYAPRPMALDPRTPVLVGVGQVTARPTRRRPGRPARARSSSWPGPSGGGRGLRGGRRGLRRRPSALLDGPRASGRGRPLGWPLHQPRAWLVAERLGHRAGRARCSPPPAATRPRRWCTTACLAIAPGRPRRGPGHRGRGHATPAAAARRDPAGRRSLDDASPSDDDARPRPSAPTGPRPPTSSWPGHRPAHPRLPALRERPAGRRGSDARRAPRAHRRPCGPASREVAAANPYAWIRHGPDGRARSSRPARTTG